MENISYDILVTDSHVDRDRLDELVDIIQIWRCCSFMAPAKRGRDENGASAYEKSRRPVSFN